jgi:hypothetical protein
VNYENSYWLCYVRGPAGIIVELAQKIGWWVSHCSVRSTSPELWRIMTATGAPYDEFQANADREIPVVVVEPGQAERPFNSTTPNALGAGQAARLDCPRTVP